MKRVNHPLIIEACYLSFYGATDIEVGKALNVSGPTVSKWRQTDVWHQMEARLIDKTITDTIDRKSSELLSGGS